MVRIRPPRVVQFSDDLFQMMSFWCFQKILVEIKENEERERALKAKEEEMVKLKVFCNHPAASQRSVKVFIHKEDTLKDATNVAYTVSYLIFIVDAVIQ